MKPFRFSLEKMQHYRQQLLDTEKDKLAALQNKRNELEYQMNQLERFEHDQKHELYHRQKRGMQAVELGYYSFFAQNIQTQKKEVRARMEIIQQQIDQQVQVVTQASQGMKSLEKLKEKQLEEYQRDEARERTEQITELIAMGM